MDKLKPYLDGLKKHHFWLITAICVLVTLYCWNRATSEIQTDFTKNKGKVNNQFTKIGEINRRPKFPNADWKEDAAKKNTEVANQIKKAADRIVKDQKAALTWSPVWSRRFRSSLKPNYQINGPRMHSKNFACKCRRMSNDFEPSCTPRMA